MIRRLLNATVREFFAQGADLQTEQFLSTKTPAFGDKTPGEFVKELIASGQSPQAAVMEVIANLRRIYQ